MPQAAASSFELALGLLIVLAAVVLAARSPVLAALIVWAGWLWEGYWHDAVQPPILHVAGHTNVMLMDIVAPTILLAASLRLLQKKRSIPPLLLALAVCALLAFARGVWTYGLQPSTNELRPWLYLLAVAVYFTTVDLTHRDLAQLVYVALAVAGLLVVAALFRWVWAAVPELPYQWLAPNGSRLRVLEAVQTLVLAQVALVLLGARSANRSRLSTFVAAVLLCFVLVLQHRTVWAALLAAAAWLFLAEPQIRKNTAVTGAVAALICLAVGMTLIGPTLASSLSSSASSGTTFSWRVDNWLMLLKSLSPLDWVIGRPFGSGYFIGLREAADVSPHSFYVSTIARMGLIGLCLASLLFARTARDIWRGRSALASAGLEPQAMLLLLVSLLVYQFTYFPYFDQGMVLGLAVAAAARARSTRPACRATQRLPHANRLAADMPQPLR